MTSYSVIHVGNSFAVKKSQVKRATKVFDLKKDAVAYAKSLCKKHGLRLFIHKADGTVQSVRQY